MTKMQLLSGSSGITRLEVTLNDDQEIIAIAIVNKSGTVRPPYWTIDQPDAKYGDRYARYLQVAIDVRRALRRKDVNANA